ncbi:DUF4360 domain-containing protein [Actinomadura vinacea]|uniref:DUF4360 domain-containing protein n=1 Tax=Actinomadura vinacea TaxID=115336 RepID=A0ABP5WUE9_9ACTN
MRRGTAIFALTLAAGTAAATAAAPVSAAAAPPDRITIDVVTVNGSGCPAGTAQVTPRPDNTGFTVSYSDYLARTGGGSEPTAYRKNCQINLAVHVPQGFTYAIASADYRGFAHLYHGASAMTRANYYFQGSSENSPVSHSIAAPYSDDWRFTDTTDAAQLAYKPCGVDRNLNINTEIRVDRGTSNPAQTSFITMDSTRGKVETLYHFAWKEC